MTAERDSLLFVYGSLRAFVDIPMARWLRTVSDYVGPAVTRGRLYDLGPYPAFREARRRDEWVAGDLYRVRNLKVLRTLDRYEAGPRSGRPRYVRDCRTVNLARRRSRLAWLYVYQPLVSPRMRIRSGDYRQHATLR